MDEEYVDTEHVWNKGQQLRQGGQREEDVKKIPVYVENVDSTVL